MPTKYMRKRLSEEVSEGIQEMIRSGEISPGERIPTERELSSRFQVSRTAVREGVKTLTAIGVLETRRGIGTFVLDGQLGPLRSTDGVSWSRALSLLLELIEFRRIVEPETAALAAQRRTDADLKEMERCVVELQKGVERGIRPPEDLGFHLELARATSNGALIDTSFMIARFYANDPSLPDEEDIAAHLAIYEAVSDGDSDAARAAMLVHFDELEVRYQRYYSDAELD